MPPSASPRRAGRDDRRRKTEAEILAAYPDLVGQDIVEALHYAAEAVRERELPLIGS